MFDIALYGDVSVSLIGFADIHANMSSTNWDSVDSPFLKAFFFRRRTGKLDWRKLSGVNLDKVVREVSCIFQLPRVFCRDTLFCLNVRSILMHCKRMWTKLRMQISQKMVRVPLFHVFSCRFLRCPHVAFAPCMHFHFVLDVRFVDVHQFTDSNFVQLFRMCQLIIEYLIYVQTFLTTQTKEKDEKLVAMSGELKQQKEIEKKQEELIKGLKKEVHTTHKVLRAQERALASLCPKTNPGELPTHDKAHDENVVPGSAASMVQVLFFDWWFVCTCIVYFFKPMPV
jgi:hypothetical protein